MIQQDANIGKIRTGRHRKTKRYAGIILILLLLFPALSCNKDENGDEIKAPDFSLESPDGLRFTLSELENRVVVLFFFSHSCPPCRTAAVRIERDIHLPYRERDDLVVLGLEISNGNSHSVETFRSLSGITFPLLMNASGVANSYGTTLDRLIVVDRLGIIRHKNNTAAGNDIVNVLEKLETLLP